MPSVSQAQHRAMEAAAHGNSTLGIPKKVGEEFSHADKGKVKKLPKRKAHRSKPLHEHLYPNSTESDGG